MNTIELWVRWAGAAFALITLLAIFAGLFRGVRRQPGRKAGAWTWLLNSWVFYLVASLIFFGLCYLLWRPLPLELSPALRITALIIGALLYFTGMAFYLWGRLALGKMYFVSTSLGAQLFADHHLIDRGPFAIVRHPMYSGLITATLGSLLLYRTWTTLILAVGFWGLVLRARREEQALRAEFGQEWQEYCRKTPAFLPTLWRGTRKEKLLKDFDTSVKYIRPVLEKYFAGENMDRLIGEAREEYNRIIPQLPYIGGKQPFTQFLTYTGMFLAIYRVSKARGKTIEEIGVMAYEIGSAYLKAYPAVLMVFAKGMNFSQLYLRRLKKRAAESHKRKYSIDYVYNYVQGDGTQFDYGVDYVECAGCKFLAAQGASELAPYLCAMDILYSESLGWGLRRTMTLAEGAEKCDFRFKKGEATKVAVPAALRGVIAPHLLMVDPPAPTPFQGDPVDG